MTTFNGILRTVCDRLQVHPCEVCSSRRAKTLVIARGLIVWLCRIYTTMSYPEIARCMGWKSHSAAIDSHRRIQAWMDKGWVLEHPNQGDLSVKELAAEMRESLTTQEVTR